MQEPITLVVEPPNEETFDGYLSFKLPKKDELEFRKAVGRNGAAYLRQAVLQIIEQVKHQKAS